MFCSAAQVPLPGVQSLHGFQPLSNYSAESTKEATRWRNRARQTRVTEMLPADDRSRAGRRCDDRRPCVNSRAQSSAEQQVDKPGRVSARGGEGAVSHLIHKPVLKTNELWQVNLIMEEGQVGLCRN